MEKTSSTEPCLKISFKKGLDAMNLPLMMTEKNGYAVYFLLDTGANKNYLRQDFINLAELNSDTVILEEVEEFYGIDNVCHQAQTCNFRFNLGEYEYMERYQIISEGAALTFPTSSGDPFHIAGILGTPFLTKYKAQMDFCTSEMLIRLPMVHNVIECHIDSTKTDYLF